MTAVLAALAIAVTCGGLYATYRLLCWLIDRPEPRRRRVAEAARDEETVRIYRSMRDDLRSHEHLWDGPPPRHRAPELAHLEEPGVVAAAMRDPLFCHMCGLGWDDCDCSGPAQWDDDFATGDDTAGAYVGEMGPDCQMACDPDCEIGPVHCWNAHRPGHKPDWHDSAACDRSVRPLDEPGDRLALRSQAPQGQPPDGDPGLYRREDDHWSEQSIVMPAVQG